MSYNITIFREGILYEEFTTKAELQAHKGVQARRCITGEAKKCETFKEVLETAATFPTTFSQLKENRRSASNLISTNLAVIDIDDSFSIEQAVSILEANNLQFGLYTSFSHQTEGKDKFHIILELSEHLTSVDDYKATYTDICKLFDHEADSQTCSPANLFFNSNEVTEQTILHEGNKFQVIKASKSVEVETTKVTTDNLDKQLSNRTLNFLLFGAADGEWHLERNLAAKNMKSAGYPLSECMDRIKRITGKLDSADKYQIKYAYENDNFEYSIAPTIVTNHPLRELYRTEDGKPVRIPIREVVTTWLADNHVTITLTEQFFVDGRYLPLDAVIEEIRHFSEAILKQIIHPTTIGSVISRLLIDTRERRLKELRDYVKFDPTAINKLDNLLPAVTLDPNDTLKRVLMHFIWQVKRKMFGKPVTYHMMPVFVGPSGSGKSVFVNKLLAPVADISYFDGDFKKLVDNREAYTLTSNYVYAMEEMAKADMADVESIKNKITSSIIQYRKLGTNITISGPNNVTFIGSSNTELRYVIKDPTSARRFFEIETPAKMGWDAVTEFDYLELWRSVDENQNEPYIMPVLEIVQELQKDMKYKAPIEEFILDNNVTSAPVNESQIKNSRKSLYQAYQLWSMDNGYKFTLSFHNFCGALRGVIGEPDRKRVNKEQIRVYYSNKMETDDLHLKLVDQET